MRPAAFLLLSAVSMSLVACVTTKEETAEVIQPSLIGGSDELNIAGAPASFDEFSSKTRSGKFETSIEQERFNLLRDAALAYSAQAGYRRRIWEVMRQLELDSPKLSKTFDFNRVAYRSPRETGYILPPVVSRTTSAINVEEDGQSAVAADEFYRLEIPGRITTVVPTWRDYLIIPLEDETPLNDDFLPQNKEEKRAFQKFSADGWKAGVEQADETLELNLAKLRRDYLGMVEYRKLAEAGLVTDLVLRSSEKRSTGEGDELYIGERRVRIVNASKFVRNPNKWKPLQRKFVAKP